MPNKAYVSVMKGFKGTNHGVRCFFDTFHRVFFYQKTTPQNIEYHIWQSKKALCIIIRVCIVYIYRLNTVNSKTFVGRIFFQIK